MVIEKIVCLFKLSAHTSLFLKLRNLFDVDGRKHILGTGWGNHTQKKIGGGGVHARVIQLSRKRPPLGYDKVVAYRRWSDRILLTYYYEQSLKVMKYNPTEYPC